MDYWKFMLWIWVSASVLAGEPVLTVEPRTLHGVPGEPLCAELSVETPKVMPVRFMIPEASNLVLRTVEKVPIQRTVDGQFIQKRTVIWQGIEAGQTVLTNLTAEIDGASHFFSNLGITVDAVNPAPPPVKEAAQ